MTMKRGTVDLNTRAAEAAQGLDPRAAGYAAGMKARAGLQKSQTPVAGGPPPAMPALEQPHMENMTMAAQAAQTRRMDAMRNVQTAMSNVGGEGSIIDRDVQAQAPPMPAHQPPANRGAPDLALLPQDMLPPDAVNDKAYQHGAGSRMAVSQPHMAAKYGVIRGGRHIPPEELVRGGAAGGPQQRSMRSMDAIRRDMEAAATAGQGAARVDDEGTSLVAPAGLPRSDEEAIAQAKAGPGGAAERAGESPTHPAISEAEEKELKERLGQLDDIDLETLRREMIRDILKNPKQKEAVEARCKPLDINELIMHNVVRQRVPIIPGSFEPTYESMRGDVELVLKRLLVQESKSVSVTENYLLDKYAVMTTAAGVVAINGNPLPTMYDAQGEFNEEKFWVKFNWLLKRPIHMLASLGVHYSWFEQRVRKLFKADEGKDG